MTNASLRERMGIDPQNAAQASAIIKLALGQLLIRPADHHGMTRQRRRAADQADAGQRPCACQR
ncbi:MAG: hypothetical protein QM788_11930 [Roseateles sp.]|uniref:hypothetical protein n=1 Tax=Roseateles sp. TaxID=1971397 RepID=UPI0039E8B41B